MAALIDKSLVTFDHELRGESRYRLLDTIKEYAASRLAASGEEDVLRLAQQLIAPVHRGPQGLLPRRGGPVTRGQQPEAVIPGGWRSAPRTARGPSPRPARWPAASQGSDAAAPPPRRCRGPARNRKGRRQRARRTAGAPRAGPGRTGALAGKAGTESGGTRQTVSPRTRSGSRLVETTRSGAGAVSRPAAVGPAPRTRTMCSQVSRMISSRGPRSASAS